MSVQLCTAVSLYEATGGHAQSKLAVADPGITNFKVMILDIDTSTTDVMETAG